MKTYTSLCLLFFFNLANAQDISLLSNTLPWWPTTYVSVPTPYYEEWPQELTKDYFFEANDLDAAHLLRGDVPGMLIARPSGNPLDQYTYKTNGMSSFEGEQQPLFIVDGFPVLSLESIDPMDIQSMEVLKDIGLTAKYGLRGANGVIMIHTYSGKNEKVYQLDTTTHMIVPISDYIEADVKLDLRYKTFVSVDQAIPNIDVLNADEYRQRGGIDALNDTDWRDEITQSGRAMAHRLSLIQQIKSLRYEVSGNYRSGKNTLLGTDYNQKSMRFSLEQQLPNYGIQWNALFSALGRDANLGDTRAYRYAQNRNPTAPVFDENNAALGGYSEATIFDYFNPVSILEQNTFEQNSYVQQAMFNAAYRLPIRMFDGRYTARINLANERNDFLQKEFYTPTSFFIGNDVNGLADWQETKQKNNYLNASLDYDERDFRIELGYRYQEFDEQGRLGSKENTGSTISFDNFYESLNADNPEHRLNDYRYTHRLISFYGEVYKHFDQKLGIQAQFAREGSSRLGVNKKWSNFGGVFIESNLKEFFKKRWKNNYKVFLSYGVAGNVPGRNNLSASIYQNMGNSFQNGEYQPYYDLTQTANPNLQAERTRELKLGLEFRRYRFKTTLNYFNKRSTDLIEADFQTPGPDFIGFYTIDQYLNFGAMRSQGFELSAVINVIDPDKFTIHAPKRPYVRWDTKLNLYAFRTKIDKKLSTYRFSPFVFNLAELGEGEVGNIQGPVFEGVTSTGQIEFEDLNNDGSYCFCEEDTKSLGNTLPRLSLGWQNKFQFKKLQIRLSMYGSFGHQLINERIYQYGRALFGNYNVPTVDYDGVLQDVVAGNQFSDLYLEKASFFRIENITFRYPFQLKNSIELITFLGFNNLLTFHKYSGGNPEVRLDQTGNGLVHGSDRIAAHPMTRSFIFGVEVNLSRTTPKYN